MISSIGRKRQENSSSKKSFTLLELILVVFLISILIGFSTPLFKKTFSNLELKNTSFDIAKTVNYAQQMAIIDKLNYKLNFDFEEGTFWVTQLDAFSDTTLFKKIKGRYGRVFSVPGGIVFTGDTDEVLFYPDGRCSEGDITLTNKYGEGYMLDIKGFGGELNIQEIKNE
ncbi:Tfp pilus assembly protein FimT/FimU [Candidatus Omnitrophota bacterium]